MCVHGVGRNRIDLGNEKSKAGNSPTQKRKQSGQALRKQEVLRYNAEKGCGEWQVVWDRKPKEVSEKPVKIHQHHFSTQACTMST